MQRVERCRKRKDQTRGCARDVVLGSVWKGWSGEGGELTETELGEGKQVKGGYDSEPF